METCPKCNSQIPNKAEFCPECGEQVTSKTSEPSWIAAMQEREKEANHTSRLNGIGFGLGIAVTALAF